MALEEMVNGAVEETKKYASKGVAGAGLGLGIAGTALGLLNGGLGGILGGGNSAGNEVADGLNIAGAALGLMNSINRESSNGFNEKCYVDKDMFYQTTIAQSDRVWNVVVDNLKTQGDTNLALSNRLGNIEASIAVANTANQYQNDISAMRAQYENELLRCYVNGQNFVRATPMITANQIGESFAGTTRVLESYPTYPERSNRSCSGLRTNCAF